MSDSLFGKKLTHKWNIYENEVNKKTTKKLVLMKFFKLIQNENENPFIISSDNSGNIYITEIKNKESNYFIEETHKLDCLCNHSKYILIDFVKSSKYNFYFSINLNPCLTIFELQKTSSNSWYEFKIIQHINLKSKNRANKYNKIIEINTKDNDYFLLLGNNRIIELWQKNDNNYEKKQIIFYKPDNNFEYILNNNWVKNYYKSSKDDNRLILFDEESFEFINVKIVQSSIDVKYISKIKNISNLTKNISTFINENLFLFFTFDYLFFVISVLTGEIVQKYNINFIPIYLKTSHDKKYFFVEKENSLMKYKYNEEYEYLDEFSENKYEGFLYKMDFSKKDDFFVIYDTKGSIFLYQ